MELPFSRRDFLKVSSAGLLGLFLADLRLERVFAAETPKQGRITLSGVEFYSEPFFNAKKIGIFGRDAIVNISGETDGDTGYGNPFNSKWFYINNEGYAYSGLIQPVETLYQHVVTELPTPTALGEITVPFCDTRREMSVLAKRGYRVYYSSTHWITDVVVNRNEKSIWYKIYDRQIQESFYVPSHEMRVIPSSELGPLSPEVREENKYIFVDLANQFVTAFEGEKPVLMVRSSSGRKDNVIDCTIETITFLGSVVRIQIKIGNNNFHMDTFNNPFLELPAIGAKEQVMCSKEAVLVL